MAHPTCGSESRMSILRCQSCVPPSHENLCIPSATAARPLILRPTCRIPDATTPKHSGATASGPTRFTTSHPTSHTQHPTLHAPHTAARPLRDQGHPTPCRIIVGPPHIWLKARCPSDSAYCKYALRPSFRTSWRPLSPCLLVPAVRLLWQPRSRSGTAPIASSHRLAAWPAGGEPR